MKPPVNEYIKSVFKIWIIRHSVYEDFIKRPASMTECTNAVACTLSCAKCKKAVSAASCMQALGEHWHVECFVCNDCACPLTSWYCQRDDMLFCKKHYRSRFDDACSHCAVCITGPVMFAGEHRYHPECFKCLHCRVFIGDGETYALVERSKLYCGDCYHENMKPCTTEVGSCQNTTQHSIQLVELRDRNSLNVELAMDRRRSSGASLTATSYLQVTSVEEATGELQVGDRIIEVNGEPVQDQSLAELDVLKQDLTRVRLTLERDCVALQDKDTETQTVNNNNNNADTTASDAASAAGHEERCVSASDDADPIARSPSSPPAHKNIKRRSTVPKGIGAAQQRPESYPAREEVGRSHSVKSSAKHRTFRASDLTVGEMLGRGFYGQAFKVKHRETGEVMVVKQLLGFDRDAQENFLKEVSVLRSLDHPNVLRFIGVLYKDKTLNFVTEYISGGTLKARVMDKKVELSWDVRFKMAHDIACGMAYLHSRDIIHRDLNSHNCLIKEDDMVVVADFGLARSVAVSTRRSLVEGNTSPEASSKRRMFRRHKCKTIVGNPYWMAPEMLNGLPYNEKVDVFSFGMIVCEIIGRTDADPDVLPRSRDFGLNEAAFRAVFGSGCPPQFFNIAVTCCKVTPDNRPSFEELDQQLSHMMTVK